MDESTVYLNPGPLYHTAPLGWSMATLRLGGTVVVMERFDAEAFLDLIPRHGVTHVFAVPTMFVRLLRLPEEPREGTDLSSLRSIIHAAAPCPPEVKRQMIHWVGPILTEYYSSSEGVGLCMIDSEEWLSHPGSVGRARWGVFHVVGPDGTELPPGECGELRVSGVRPVEYFDDPVRTAAMFDHRGWASVGDLGHMDEDGYVHLSGRRSDLILSGGVNIYPREIEEALLLHPAVEDAGVIGLPDREMGQRVHAVVKPAGQYAGSDELAAELIAFLRDVIAGFKVPRSISFEDDFPRMESGKVRHHELLRRLEASGWVSA